MSDLESAQVTQPPPHGSDTYLGDVFLSIIRGSAAIAAGGVVAAVGPVVLGAAAVLGTAGYAAYTVGTAVRGTSGSHPAPEDKGESEEGSNEVLFVDGRSNAALLNDGKSNEQSADVPEPSVASEDGDAEQPAAKIAAEVNRLLAEQQAAKREAEAKQLVAEQESAAQEAEAKRVAAEQDAEVKRLAVEQKAVAREAEAKRLALEKDAKRIAKEQADAERLATERADAERGQQVRLKNAAAILLQQVDGTRRANPKAADENEVLELELKRQKVRDALTAIPLTDGVIEQAGDFLDEFDRMLGEVKNQVLDRAKQQTEVRQRQQAEKAAAAEHERQRKAVEAASLAQEAWRKVAEKAKAVLANVNKMLNDMKDVVDANAGMGATVSREAGVLSEKLAAGASGTPNEAVRTSVEKLAQTLENWEVSVTNTYNDEMKRHLQEAIQSNGKAFVQERGRLISALMSSTSTAGDISDAYTAMLAKQGPWTAEDESKPAKTPKKRAQTIDIEPIGMSNLMNALPHCLVPTDISWKPEGAGAKRNSFYKYSNGVEIHVHRNTVGRATKAHAKLSAHNLTMGTAMDNDIPTANLPAHGIQVTENPVQGLQVA